MKEYMSMGLNKNILNKLAEKCEGKENIKKFINEILLIESENNTLSWWKDTYKKSVEKYSGGERDENK